MIALALAAGAAIALLLALFRLMAGPTLHDRALAAKTLIMRVVMICAALAVAAAEPAWLDVALALMLGALVLMAAVLKVFRARTFQAPLAPPLEEA